MTLKMELNLDYLEEIIDQIGINEASALLKELIVSSKDPLSRQKALRIFSSIDNGKNFKFFEQLFLSDENFNIRLETGYVLRDKYLRHKKFVPLLEFTLNKLDNVQQKLLAVEILNLINTTNSRKILIDYLKRLIKTEFKSKFEKFFNRILTDELVNPIPSTIIDTCINLILYDYYSNKCRYHITTREGKIVSLNCEGSNLKKISEILEFNRLIYLEHLLLQRNKIKNMEGFAHLNRLKTLNLSNNQLGRIENLEVLKETLEELDLSNNKIEKIENLESLRNLRKLSLDSNLIKEIEGLENLVNLEELNLSSNNIRVIKTLNYLLKLRKLNLSFNKLEKISGLNKLRNLLWLYLNNNLIKCIENLDTLKDLKGLYLSNNGIETIKNLTNLTKIRKLELSNNSIQRIQGLENLRKLQEIFLDKNNISKLEGLDNLENLIILFLENNEISEFSNENIENLKNLNFIFLNENPLTPKSWEIYRKKTKYP